MTKSKSKNELSPATLELHKMLKNLRDTMVLQLESESFKALTTNAKIGIVIKALSTALGLNMRVWARDNDADIPKMLESALEFLQDAINFEIPETIDKNSKLEDMKPHGLPS